MYGDNKSNAPKDGFRQMNINFFEWLRSGVRQSVLLGVSDAVEQLGTPAAEDELHPSVIGFLNGNSGTAKKSRATGTKRKRLGKSLKELDMDGAK